MDLDPEHLVEAVPFLRVQRVQDIGGLAHHGIQDIVPVALEFPHPFGPAPQRRKFPLADGPLLLQFRESILQILQLHHALSVGVLEPRALRIGLRQPLRPRLSLPVGIAAISSALQLDGAVQIGAEPAWCFRVLASRR